MSHPFTITIPDDQTSGLPQYCTFLTYLKEHPEVPTESKFEIQLLMSMSRRLQTLQTTYAGLFQMEETDVPKIKSMRGYILIMLKKLVPNLIVEFIQTEDNRFTIATSGAILDLIITSMTKETATGAGRNTFESDDTELDSQLEKDMMAVAEQMESDRLNDDRFETPVRHIHTKQGASATSSVTTKNSTYAAMTGKVSSSLAPPHVTPAKQAKLQENQKNEEAPESQNVTNPATSVTKVNESKLANPTDLSPIYAFEDGNGINIGTFLSNQTTQSPDDVAGDNAIMKNNVQSVQKSPVIPPGTGNAANVAISHASSDGYTLGTEGVKCPPQSEIQTSGTKTVDSGNSKNAFEILKYTDDENDVPVDGNQESDETPMSPILLQPKQQSKSMVLKAIRDNIAHSPKPVPNASPQTKSTKKKNLEPQIPGTFALNDKKLCEQSDGFDRIENCLKRN